MSEQKKTKKVETENNTKEKKNKIHRFFSLLWYNLYCKDSFFTSDDLDAKSAQNRKYFFIHIAEVCAGNPIPEYDKRTGYKDRKEFYEGFDFESVFGKNLIAYFGQKNKRASFFNKGVVESFLSYCEGKINVKNLSNDIAKTLTNPYNKIKIDSFINAWRDDGIFEGLLGNANSPEEVSKKLAEQLSTLLFEKKSEQENIINSNSTDSFPASLIYPGGKLSDADEICDFIVKEKHKHILISGEGGLGKTTFLEWVSSPDSGFSLSFKGIYYISLSKLSVINSEKIKHGFGKERFKNIDSSYICTEIRDNKGLSFDWFGNFMKKGKNRDEPYLLLLDGLNELDDCADINNRKAEIMNEITFLAQNTDVCIVIASRSKVKFEGIIPEFTEATLSGTPDDEIEKYSKEVKKLVRIPMYYIMVKDLEKDGKSIEFMTKYSLLEYSWKKLYSKSTETHTKDKRAFYFCFAPELAQYMVNNRMGHQIKRNTAIGFFNDNMDAIIKTPYDNALDNSYSIRPSEIVDTLIRENIMNEEKGLLSFKHQDWCEFLAAFSLKRKYERIKECWENEAFNADEMPVFDLNVPETVIEMFLQAMGIDEEISERCNSIITIISEFSNSFEVSSMANDKDIIYIEMLCQLADCIPHSQNKEIRKALSDLIEKAFWIYVIGNSVIASEHTLPLMINIIIKQTEHLRNEECYRTALKWINYAEKRLNERWNSSLDNQKGKVYLYYSQKLYRGEEIDPDETISDIGNQEEAFKAGFDIISKNAKVTHNNMSSNLFAFMESMPAPFIRENNLVEINYVDAFWTYFDVLNSTYNYSGKDLVYTLRQCTALLIKGYVKVDEDSDLMREALKMYPSFNIFSMIKSKDSEYRNCIVNACENGVPNYAPDTLNKSTVLLAESILEIIKYETNDKYVLFLTGCVEFAKDKHSTATEEILKKCSDCGDLQAKILLCNLGRVGKEECICFYKEMRKKIAEDTYGQIDRCHIRYPVIETEQLMKHFQIV